MMEFWADYLSLFTASFVAATILPAQSELVLSGLILAQRAPVWALVSVASLGNVGGSIVNYWLGRALARFESARWFPVKREALDKAEALYRRWGRWSLLLSFAPIIGDPLTVVAGALRERFSVFVVLVTISKVGRYLALVWAIQTAGG
jgi:membrane protein YqaA with SNARE-associated domain